MTETDPEALLLPLAGYTVAVTAARRKEELGALLDRRGARVVYAPAIRIVPLSDDAGPAAVQQGAELLLAAGGGDRDRVAGQRQEGSLRIGLGHVPMVRRPCSGRVSWR